MNNSSKLFYAQKLLKKRLQDQKNKNNSKNISVIVSFIASKQASFEQTKKRHTKEQLYAMGYNAIQIHKYFIFKNNYWILKENLIINNEIIQTLAKLSQILNINNLKNAG